MIKVSEMRPVESSEVRSFVELSEGRHALIVNAARWANASKVFAIFGTVLISYLGMRLWVFVSKSQKESTMLHTNVPVYTHVSDDRRSVSTIERRDMFAEREQDWMSEYGNSHASGHSLSVVLPAYNEEQVIASTISDILNVLNTWQVDFEVVVVNDGSTDRTGAIVAALVDTHPQLRLITHPTNQGYGAALVSGFAAATKELTFFMDSDGQFDIRDLHMFFPFIGEYDAVMAY